MDTQSPPAKFLLVDDHAMFRSGLRLLLLSKEPGAVIKEAESGASALQSLRDFTPDIVVMDLHLPDQTGIEVSRDILTRIPSAKIVMLSAEHAIRFVNEALQVGVSAYLLKDSAPDELLQALAAVRANRLYLCPRVNSAFLEEYRTSFLSAQVPPKPTLSGREREVLRMVAEGLRTKEIAARLQLGVKTAETYRRRLMKKLGCNSTAEVVRYALREGLVEP
jgi:DNA-binding NarL/FixJ family response regulator